MHISTVNISKTVTDDVDVTIAVKYEALCAFRLAYYSNGRLGICTVSIANHFGLLV